MKLRVLKHPLAVAGLALGIACAPKFRLTPQQRADIVDIANQPLTCESPEECEAVWGKVTSEISKQCGFKIQTSSAYLVETDEPVSEENGPVACKAVRTPIGATSAQIVVTTQGADADKNLVTKALIVDNAIKMRDSMREPTPAAVPDPAHPEPRCTAANCLSK
jgi:hypothetical protein